jgi:hypothetical protein
MQIYYFLAIKSFLSRNIYGKFCFLEAGEGFLRPQEQAA